MPIRLAVGVCRKIGQPRYGSYGASCALEVELSPGELASLDRLQGQIRRGLEVCRTAVDAELALARRATAAEAPTRAAVRPATRAQIRAVHAIVRRRRLDLHRALDEQFEGRGLDVLRLAEASALIDALQAEDVGESIQA